MFVHHSVFERDQIVHNSPFGPQTERLGAPPLPAENTDGPLCGRVRVAILTDYGLRGVWDKEDAGTMSLPSLVLTHMYDASHSHLHS
eukprot:CAMPEP_0172004788 /NCGR_PEP_ID=MMETSP1041-20130122/4677_1 /TAXON_ID=464988 /ORGANISM="Hemiselmis andersenii, Strain CCMP439" /LENGTH=86 /DNA_ID=CAMNT_0012658693 /DNA_START=508 /DNA_END=768 /DNA_ORIENTATION=-